MDKKTYRITFYGDIHSNHQLDNVKKQFAELYKKNVSQVENVFSGKKIVLKNKTSIEACEKIQKALTKIGMICNIEKIPPVKKDSKNKTVKKTTVQQNQKDKKSNINQQTQNNKKSNIKKASQKKQKTMKLSTVVILVCSILFFGLVIFGLDQEDEFLIDLLFNLFVIFSSIIGFLGGISYYSIKTNNPEGHKDIIKDIIALMKLNAIIIGKQLLVQYKGKNTIDNTIDNTMQIVEVDRNTFIYTMGFILIGLSIISAIFELDHWFVLTLLGSIYTIIITFFLHWKREVIIFKDFTDAGVSLVGIISIFIAFGIMRFFAKNSSLIMLGISFFFIVTYLSFLLYCLYCIFLNTSRHNQFDRIKTYLAFFTKLFFSFVFVLSFVLVFFMKPSERKEGETAREYNQRLMKEEKEKEAILAVIIEIYAYVVEFFIVRKAELSSISTYLYLDYDKTQLSTEQKQAAINFFQSSFSMIAKLAMADGDVTEDELHVIENLMREELNLGPDDVEMAVSIFNNALLDTTPFELYASTFYQDFQSKPQLLELMLEILLRVSYADGVLNINEEKMLLLAAKIFKFREEEYESIKSRYDQTSTNNKYYAILGCSPDDPFEIIKKCYRNMVVEYHPDKISSKGLPEEFILFANEKFKEIQKAYEIIKKERNIG